jgi:RNA polymerase sigma factor (sigma-70 family)
MSTLVRVPPVFNDDISDFYVNNHRWLQTWLYKKLGGASEAADLAQDVFASILTREPLQLIASIQEPRAYLTTIAQRLLCNYFKRQSLEQAYIEAIANHPENIVISAEDRLILLETLYQIDAMLDGLPVLVRRAFLLSQLEGLEYAEIAEQLQVSVRTIKRYMAKAFEQCLMCMV